MADNNVNLFQNLLGTSNVNNANNLTGGQKNGEDKSTSFDSVLMDATSTVDFKKNDSTTIKVNVENNTNTGKADNTAKKVTNEADNSKADSQVEDAQALEGEDDVTLQKSNDVTDGKETVEAKEKVAEEIIVTEDGAIDEELAKILKALEMYATAIVQAVSEATSIPVDDISATMTELNMNATELVDTGNLAEVFTNVMDDMTTFDVINDDAFLDAAAEITTITNDLLENLQMNMEELLNKVNEAIELLNGNVDVEVNAESLVNEEVVINEPVITDNEVKLAEDSTVEKNVIFNDEPVKANLSEEEAVDTAKNAVVDEAINMATTESNEDEDNGANDLLKDNDDTRSIFNKKDNHDVKEHVAFNNATTTHTINAEGMEVVKEVHYTDLKNLVSEVTDYIRYNALSEDIKTLELQLTPANLGKVLVEVSTNNGVVSAKIVTETEVAKEAMENNLSNLKENLENQGVKIEDVEVTVESHAFEQNLQQDGSKEQQDLANEMKDKNRRVNLNLNEMTLDDLQGLMSEEDMIIAKMMRDNGNVMNLSA